MTVPQLSIPFRKRSRTAGLSSATRTLIASFAAMIRVNVSTVDGSVSRTRFYVQPGPLDVAPDTEDWTAARAVVLHTPVDMEPATGVWWLGGDGSTPSLAGSIRYFHAITDGFSTWRGVPVATFDVSDLDRGFAAGRGWWGDPGVVWTLEGDVEYEGPAIADRDPGKPPVTTTTVSVDVAPSTTTTAPPVTRTAPPVTSTTVPRRSDSGHAPEAYDAARVAGVRNGLSGMWVSRDHPGIHWFVVDHLGLAADGWTLFGIDARSARLVYRGHFSRGGEGQIPGWADVEDLTGVHRNGRWYLAIWDNGLRAARARCRRRGRTSLRARSHSVPHGAGLGRCPGLGERRGDGLVGLRGCDVLDRPAGDGPVG